MADFVVVPANILPSAGASLQIGTAGAVIAQGDVLYQDPTDSTWKLADANVASPVYKAAGIAQSAATAIGQPVIVLTSDTQLCAWLRRRCRCDRHSLGECRQARSRCGCGKRLVRDRSRRRGRSATRSSSSSSAPT
jgi:hypothetical protein